MQCMQGGGPSIEDSMVITGLQIQRKGQKGASVANKKGDKKDPSNMTTETSFRPNKFGVGVAGSTNAANSNKTQDSF